MDDKTKFDTIADEVLAHCEWMKEKKQDVEKAGKNLLKLILEIPLPLKEIVLQIEAKDSKIAELEKEISELKNKLSKVTATEFFRMRDEIADLKKVREWISLNVWHLKGCQRINRDIGKFDCTCGLDEILRGTHD